MSGSTARTQVKTQTAIARSNSIYDPYSSYAARSASPRAHTRHASLHALYTYVLRRAWKRVTRATRKEQRASVLPDGFVLVGAAAANARRAARRSVVFA